MDDTPRKFGTIDWWIESTGMGRTATYDALRRGNLKAVKVGRRTLIDLEAGLAWLRSCPPAAFDARAAA